MTKLPIDALPEESVDMSTHSKAGMALLKTA